MERRRDNVLDWDSTFMGIAKLIAMRSKDPNTQVGAVIVAKDKRILSLGYNGLPAGMSDDDYKLTDDINGSSNHADGNWVGYDHLASITRYAKFDLGAVYDVNAFTALFHANYLLFSTKAVALDNSNTIFNKIQRSFINTLILPIVRRFICFSFISKYAPLFL